MIVLNEDRQFKMTKKAKDVEEIRGKMKKLAMDMKTSLSEKEKLEEENLSLTKSLKRSRNYDEIHIEVDILSQSGPGVEILKHKYGMYSIILKLPYSIKWLSRRSSIEN